MYDVVFAEEAAGELAALDSPMERRKVYHSIQCLTLDPTAGGIGEVIDSSGRINKIGLSGSTAYVFFADHLLRKIRILAVQSIRE